MRGGLRCTGEGGLYSSSITQCVRLSKERREVIYQRFRKRARTHRFFAVHARSSVDPLITRTVSQFCLVRRIRVRTPSCEKPAMEVSPCLLEFRLDVTGRAFRSYGSDLGCNGMFTLDCTTSIPSCCASPSVSLRSIQACINSSLYRAPDNAGRAKQV